MAQYVMRDLVKKAGLEKQFEIASAATHYDEIGSPVYPPARRMMMAHGINCSGHSARLLTKADYNRWDYLIGMDSANLRNMKRKLFGDPENKVKKLLDYTDNPREVADPYWTGDFEATWQDVMDGCTALLEELRYLK